MILNYAGLWDEGSVFKGGQGNDTLWTTAGADIIEYQFNDGRDLITDFYHYGLPERFSSTSEGARLDQYGVSDGVALDFKYSQLSSEQQHLLVNKHDIVRFGAGITTEHISFEQDQNDLVINVSNSGQLQFENWFLTGFNQYGYIEQYADNWTGNNINQLGKIEFENGIVWEGKLLEDLVSGEISAPKLNHAVTVVDQLSYEGSQFRYQLPVDTFIDNGAGDSLTLTASLLDGTSLPNWLSFDSATQTLSAKVPSDDSGVYSFKMTAKDKVGLTASKNLSLTIKPVIAGSSVNDTLTGSDQNDMISGGEGNDILIGGQGDDILIADTGSDWLQGGEGQDTLVFSKNASWSSAFIAYNAGSPGNIGTKERVRITAMQRSHDLFDGGEGFDIALGTDAIFLHDTFSPLPNGTGPRIQGIERFNMGAGDDIVDLTSPLYAYGHVELNGEDGNDVLWGSAGNDVLTGGKGNDRLSGGAGNDRYLFARGDNQDTIVEQDSNPDSHDILRFSEDINHDQLWFTRQNDDLRIQVISTLDQLTIANWYQGEDKQLEEIQATDGKVLVHNQIDQLVLAMASFNPPSAGEISLPNEQQQQLALVLATFWTSG